MAIPLRFYLDFWRRDFRGLTPEAQKSLEEFLQDLQTDPERINLLVKCQQDQHDKDVWAHFFCGAHVIYWRFAREHVSMPNTLTPAKVIRIDVLELRFIRLHPLRAERPGVGLGPGV